MLSNNNTSQNNTTTHLPIAKPVNNNFVDVPITPNTPIAAVIINHVEINPKMKKTILYSKTLNIICILDLIFGLCYSLYYPYFLLPILFSITGYLGTKWFHKNLIIVYLIYIVFNFFFKLLNFSWLLEHSNEIHTNTSFVILSIILYFFELIIILVVCKFFHLLKDLLDTEIKFLRTNSTVQKQFICNC